MAKLAREVGREARSSTIKRQKGGDGGGAGGEKLRGEGGGAGSVKLEKK